MSFTRNARVVRGHLSAALAIAMLPVLCGCLAAGPQRLTEAELFGPSRVDFNGHVLRGLDWWPAGGDYLERRDGVLSRINAETGDAAPAYDYAALEAALAAHEDFDADAASHLARHPTLHSEDYRVVVLRHADRLYYYDFNAGELRRLTDDAAERRELTLSLDLRHVAFVQENDLNVMSTADGAVRRLTEDGSETLLNGVLDWVYQEEVYGRGNWRAHWWSDDSEYIAFLQLDETDVPTYPVVDYRPTHPTVTLLRYPKAGDPNPRVRLGVLPAGGGGTVWVDLTQYEGTDILITGVLWAPDGRVVYAVQDREQRWLDLNDADPATGQARTLLHEDSPAWIEYQDPPHWLEDGSYLWLGSRDGWQHLYHYARDGTLIRRLTAGPWEVRALHGVDEHAGYAYFSGSCESPIERNAYRVPLAGGTIERLTTPGFSHNVEFDPDFHYFIDTYSNIKTPTRVDLRRVTGEVVRVLSENDVPALRQYRLSWPELLRIPTPAGYELNAQIVRPLDRLPWQRHPVYTIVYGGPHAPSVHNRWPHDLAFQQWLTQQGYIVFVCDPYSASGESAASAWRAYQQLGVTELADLEAALRWLAEHEHADLDRTAIFGHSYGGYMAAYALTHGSLFKAGIVVAGLADWRNYDSIYTERYMRTPQNNPEGYERSSVAAAAKDLHGHLLILHGLQDDNVHAQNGLQLMHALQQAGQPFEVMLYPGDDHGVHTYYAERQQLGLEFLRQAFGH